MFRSNSPKRRHLAAGFTLLEVLVAISVVAVLLAAIGALVAANIRATRSLDQRLSLLEMTRSILTGLPDRKRLVRGSLRGETAQYNWRVDVQPYVGNSVDPRQASPWVPESVVIRVQAPSGQILRLDTVRLRRAERPAR